MRDNAAASVCQAWSSGGPSTAESALTGEIEALEARLHARDQELDAARRENLALRTSALMLGAELRSAEDDAQTDSNAAQVALDAARTSLTEVSRELRNEESIRQTLVAENTRRHEEVRAEAAANRAAVAAEIGLFEIAERAQEDFNRQRALASDRERALVAEELDTTERNLAAASAHAVRVLARARAAEDTIAGGGVRAAPRPPADATSASAPRPRNDGLTAAEAATGPSGADGDVAPNAEPLS